MGYFYYGELTIKKATPLPHNKTKTKKRGPWAVPERSEFHFMTKRQCVTLNFSSLFPYIELKMAVWLLSQFSQLFKVTGALTCTKSSKKQPLWMKADLYVQPVSAGIWHFWRWDAAPHTHNSSELPITFSTSKFRGQLQQPALLTQDWITQGHSTYSIATFITVLSQCLHFLKSAR